MSAFRKLGVQGIAGRGAGRFHAEWLVSKYLLAGFADIATEILENR
jgi:hypothetical protein